MADTRAGHWVLIANPTAGGGKGHRTAERAATSLRKMGRSVELRFTRARGHAPELARQAVEEKAKRLVICGGDGTIHEVLSVLSGSQTVLGLLPFGTGNDLARALKIPRQLDAAVQVLASGQTRALDLGRVGEALFCTVAAFGFDAEISRAMSTGQIPISGTLGYIYAALRRLPSYRFPTVRLEGEFGVYEGPALLVAMGNTSSYGGGLKIAPHADPTDGKFDVCLVGEISKGAILRLMLRVFSGGHLHHPAVRLERTAWLKIETAETHIVQADGEYLCETPAVVEVQPATLQVVVPSGT